MSSSLLWAEFHSRTGALGDRVAVQTPAGSVTFDAIWSGAERLASDLLATGVEEGRVVGLMLRDSPRFLPAFLALCRLGTTVALLPPQYGQSELGAIASGVGLSSIVADEELAEGIAAAVPMSRSTAADGLEVLLPAEAGDIAAAEPEALLKFSSGSTAEPKGIALTAANLLTEVENVVATLDLGRADRVLAGVPLFHSYGFDLGVLPTLYSGTTLLLEDAFVPRRTLIALAESGATAFLGVPAQYRSLLATRVSGPLDLSGVRWLLSCTAPLAPETVLDFSDRFGVPICQHYGSSETGAVTTHVPSEVRRRPASVGRPMAGVQVSVVDADGGALLPGADGEVVVSSGAVARRYVLGAPPGPSPLGSGKFQTGDLGCIDPEGFLTLAGRRDAMINVGGFKVSPTEVAATLERHPAVREAAVLGVPDGRGEEVVYAAAALSRSVDEAELLAFCRGALAEYKVPRRIEIRDALPRTASGKVRLRLGDLDA
ncbi:MAG: class I adenylate-forming enzyme family protein [Gaiellaceae bacterium]